MRLAAPFFLQLLHQPSLPPVSTAGQICGFDFMFRIQPPVALTLIQNL